MFSWQTHTQLPAAKKQPNQKVTRQPKCFSFFFFFFFRWASSSLCHSFMMVFAQNRSIFYWAGTSPSLFYRFEVWFEPLTEELWLPLRCHFFSSHIRMCTNHLATKCNYYARLLNPKYSWRAGSVWREPGWVNVSSANISYIYWGSLRGQTCCSVIDGKLQFKHASAAKRKWHERE